jgi:predicted phage terminase large subunit-like protein
MQTQHSATVAKQLAEALSSSWRMKARPEQIAPQGDWQVWLLMAGRGFGKTRCGAEWVHEQIMAGCSRIALVGATAADVRDVMIEGESGILATSQGWNRPEYQPALRRITWPNGAIAMAYSADEPERLRGPQHDAAWCDELGAWRYAEAWDQLQFGLRIGKKPRVVVTTTPKPTKILQGLIARESTGEVVVTRGRTRDNIQNLAPGFVAAIEARYKGTRLGRQELDGEFLEDIPGALFQRSWFEKHRTNSHPDLHRVVVAIDPAASSKEGSDETGIVVAGRENSRGYVLEDGSGRYAPHEWAAKAIDLYRTHNADCIVAEVNNGGEMVEATLRMINKTIPFKAVHASRGKVTRAEPIAALYEQGKISHVGEFRELEDQAALFTSDYDRNRDGSPDRLDALVWAMTELMSGRVPLVISDEALAQSRLTRTLYRMRRAS